MAEINTDICSQAVTAGTAGQEIMAQSEPLPLSSFPAPPSTTITQTFTAFLYFLLIIGVFLLLTSLF